MKAFLLLLLVSTPLFAACHAVGPTATGAGTGADWNNQMVQPTGSGWVRGDTYYFADGSYGRLSLSTAVSGSTTIELRKAQSYDNGSSCGTSIAAGWNTSTMGSAQAVWQNTSSGGASTIDIGSGGFLIFNGNGQNAGTTEVGCGGVNLAPPSTMTGNAPSITACGLKWDDSTCTSTASNGCDGGSGFIHGGGANITIESMDWKGQGLNSNGNNNSETYMWFANGGTLTNVTLQHNYFHNAGTTYFTVVSGGWNNGVYAYNYGWGIFDGSTNHGEAIQLQGSNGQTTKDVIHHNVFRDQQTNGDVVAVITGTQTYDFYDNTDFCSASGTSTTCRHNDGVIGCFNSQTCTSVNVYNNTFNFPSNCGYNVSGGPSTMNWENNILFGCGSFGRTGGTVAIDFNSYLNSSQAAIGAHDVSATGVANPFTSAGTSVQLSADSANYNNRTSLGGPYDTTDLYGNAFTTDRGAAQFVPALPPAMVGLATTQTDITSSITAQYTSNGAGVPGSYHGPAYNSTIIDGVSGAKVYRIPIETDCPPARSPCTSDTLGINVDYSKVDAFSHDHTWGLFPDPTGWLDLWQAAGGVWSPTTVTYSQRIQLSATTNAFAANANDLAGDPSNYLWAKNPATGSKIYYTGAATGSSVGKDALKLFDPVAKTATVVHDFTSLLAASPCTGAVNIDMLREGNQSNDDSHWAFVGDDNSGNQFCVISYNLSTNTVIATKGLGAGGLCGASACPTPNGPPINWVGFDPTGTYIAANYNQTAGSPSALGRGLGTEAFDQNWTFLTWVDIGDSHADWMTTQDGHVCYLTFPYEQTRYDANALACTDPSLGTTTVPSSGAAAWSAGEKEYGLPPTYNFTAPGPIGGTFIGRPYTISGRGSNGANVGMAILSTFTASSSVTGDPGFAGQESDAFVINTANGTTPGLGATYPLAPLGRLIWSHTLHAQSQGSGDDGDYFSQTDLVCSYDGTLCAQTSTGDIDNGGPDNGSGSPIPNTTNAELPTSPVLQPRHMVNILALPIGASPAPVTHFSIYVMGGNMVIQ